MAEHDEEIANLKSGMEANRVRAAYEQRLLMQYAIARVLAHADSLDAAAPRVLELITEQLDWRLGILWMLREDEAVLRYAAHWEKPSPNQGELAGLFQSVSIGPGDDLPGRVWSTAVPAWIPDLQQDDCMVRHGSAVERGLRSALAFPITFGERVYGVLEFFSEQARPEDAELLEMGASLGYQIGEFLERTHAQQRLAESEESFRVLTETASDGIITIDAASSIIFANSAAARIFGYTTEELIGADLTIVMPERLRALHLAGLEQYLETGQRHVNWQAFRVVGQHRAGYEIPIEVSFGEYRGGNKHFFVGIIRDITERLRLDEALQQTTKLESLGVLAGGIAHDFNNLLTGILGNASLALDIVGEANPATEILKDAIEASERATHLTKQLLAYAGKGRFVIEPIDVSALVREISTLIRSSIPQQVTLRLDLEQPLPPVEGDIAQLQQLIMNLVINGAEAIPEGRQGTVLVIVRAQEISAGELATLGTDDLAPGSYIGISVHDNGVGMDEATLSKIFDPFFSTKFTGRGLGLAAAAGIVRGHKGALKVFSSPGQGTTFRVLLPVSSEARVKTAEKPPVPIPAGGGEVLVIDDEPVVRKIAAASLERYGYTVITAESVSEAVERFRELHARLQLVILDMTTPGMTGEEALELIRRIDPAVPVILSSGFSELEALKRFAGKGLAGFLQKPYTAAQLLERVQAILRRES